MKPTSDLGIVLGALYLSEINCSIASFFDSGWTAKIGDSINGFKAENSMLYSTVEVAEWLTAEVCRLLPESDFAQNKDDLNRWTIIRLIENWDPSGSILEKTL